MFWTHRVSGLGENLFTLIVANSTTVTHPRFPGFRETELADMGLFQLLCTFLHVVVFTTINKTYLICPNEYEAKCVG